jgi:anti-anti-sigma factor
VSLKVTLERVDQKIILRLDGRIDASSASLLEKKLHQLVEENHRSLLLDFTRVCDLSSPGVRVLVSISKKLEAIKGYLLLFSLEDQALEMIQMAGFDKMLHICSSEKEALQFHQK